MCLGLFCLWVLRLWIACCALSHLLQYMLIIGEYACHTEINQIITCWGSTSPQFMFFSCEKENSINVTQGLFCPLTQKNKMTHPLTCLERLNWTYSFQLYNFFCNGATCKRYEKNSTIIACDWKTSLSKSVAHLTSPLGCAI